jgi:hypothetical protein
MAGRHFICPLPLVRGKEESIAGRWPASVCGDEPVHAILSFSLAGVAKRVRAMDEQRVNHPAGGGAWASTSGGDEPFEVRIYSESFQESK